MNLRARQLIATYVDFYSWEVACFHSPIPKYSLHTLILWWKIGGGSVTNLVGIFLKNRSVRKFETRWKIKFSFFTTELSKQYIFIDWNRIFNDPHARIIKRKIYRYNFTIVKHHIISTSWFNEEEETKFERNKLDEKCRPREKLAYLYPWSTWNRWRRVKAARLGWEQSGTADTVTLGSFLPLRRPPSSPLLASSSPLHTCASTTFSVSSLSPTVHGRMRAAMHRNARDTIRSRIDGAWNSNRIGSWSARRKEGFFAYEVIIRFMRNVQLVFLSRINTSHLRRVSFSFFFW